MAVWAAVARALSGKGLMPPHHRPSNPSPDSEGIALTAVRVWWGRARGADCAPMAALALAAGVPSALPALTWLRLLHHTTLRAGWPLHHQQARGAPMPPGCSAPLHLASPSRSPLDPFPPPACSVDPATDKPADLKRVVAAAGHPGLVALTGGADGVRASTAWVRGVWCGSAEAGSVAWALQLCCTVLLCGSYSACPTPVPLYRRRCWSAVRGARAGHLAGPARGRAARALAAA